MGKVHCRDCSDLDDYNRCPYRGDNYMDPDKPRYCKAFRSKGQMQLTTIILRS